MYRLKNNHTHVITEVAYHKLHWLEQNEYEEILDPDLKRFYVEDFDDVKKSKTELKDYDSFFSSGPEHSSYVEYDEEENDSDDSDDSDDDDEGDQNPQPIRSIRRSRRDLPLRVPLRAIIGVSRSSDLLQSEPINPSASPTPIHAYTSLYAQPTYTNLSMTGNVLVGTVSGSEASDDAVNIYVNPSGGSTATNFYTSGYYNIPTDISLTLTSDRLENNPSDEVA